MLSFFPPDVLDEILDLIESISEGFPTYSCFSFFDIFYMYSLFSIALLFPNTAKVRCKYFLVLHI